MSWFQFHMWFRETIRIFTRVSLYEGFYYVDIWSTFTPLIYWFPCVRAGSSTWLERWFLRVWNKLWLSVLMELYFSTLQKRSRKLLLIDPTLLLSALRVSTYAFGFVAVAKVLGSLSCYLHVNGFLVLNCVQFLLPVWEPLWTFFCAAKTVTTFWKLSICCWVQLLYVNFI